MLTSDEIENPNDLDFVDKGKIFLYKYIDLSSGVALIENKTFKFSNPKDFNDPFDIYEKLIDFSQHEIVQQLQMSRKEKRKLVTVSDKAKIRNLKHEWKKLRSYYGISCFSKTYKSILMWSHYAQKHTGICIGFYVDADLLMANEFYTFGVKYENDFETLPFTSLDKNRMMMTITQYLSLKAIFWKYEKEVRLIHFDYFRDYKNEFMKFEKYAEIREIYFGLRTNENDKLKIKKLFSKDRIKPKFFEMTPLENKFEIERK